MPAGKHAFLTASSPQACFIAQDVAFPEQIVSSVSISRCFGDLVKTLATACGCVSGRVITKAARISPRHRTVPSVKGMPCAGYIGHTGGLLKSWQERVVVCFRKHQFSVPQLQTTIVSS